MKTRLFSVLLLSAMLAGTARADVATYKITRAEQPPALDGVLDDKCWENAPAFSRFRTLIRDTTTAPVPSTTAMLCYDEDWLYVAYRCVEPLMDKLSALYKNHDGAVWRDDCIEIMLNPSGDRTRYFHIVVNAAGVVRDAYWRSPGNEDLSWESGAQVKTRLGKSEWTVEMRIPIGNLNLAGPEAPWTFHLVRTRNPVVQHLTMLDAAMDSYHELNHFARLEGFRFRKRPIGFVKGTLGELYEGINLAKVTLRNHGGKPEPFRVVLRVGQKGEPDVRDGAAPAGKEITVQVPWRLKRPADQRVSLDLYHGERRIGGLVRRIKQVPNLLGQPKKTSFVIDPDRPIRVNLPVNLAEGSRKNARVQWKATDAAGKVVEQGLAPVTAPHVELQLKGKNWRAGRYQLHVTLEADGKELASRQTAIVLIESPFGA